MLSGRVVVDVDGRSADLGTAGKLRDSIRGRDRRIEIEQLQKTVRSGPKLSLNRDLAGLKRQRIDRQSAALTLKRDEVERRCLTDELAHAGRQKGRERAVEIGGDTPPLRRAVQLHGAIEQLLAAGRETDLHRQIVQRPGAFDRRAYGRTTLDVREVRDDAIGWLVQRYPKVHFLAARIVGRGNDELTARPIDPGGRQRGGEAALDQLQRPGDADGRLLPEQWLAQKQFANRQLIDLDRERQLGDREAARLEARRGVGVRHGGAQHLDPIGGEALNVQPPAQQRAARPIDDVAFETKPNALAIRHGNEVNRRLARQRALNAADADDAVVGGKAVLDELQEAALVFLRVLRVRDGKGKEEQQKCQEVAHQKACPNPT